MQTNIKNILFDLGGVLIDLDVRRSLAAFQRLMGHRDAQESDIPCTPGGEGLVTAQGLMGGHDSELINLYQTGEISTEDFISTILQACMPGTTRQQVVDAWFAMLLGISDEKKSILSQLIRKGYNIYVLSNINELHVEWTMANCKELLQAKHLFFSNEIHLAKPDPRCFDLVIQQAHIRPEETLYVDDLIANIEAGKKAGFITLHATNDDWVNQMQAMLS